MSWFVELTLRNGEKIHVRPEMVKAVRAKTPGVTNIVVDGHDFDVSGTVTEVLSAVEYHMQPVEL